MIGQRNRGRRWAGLILVGAAIAIFVWSRPRRDDPDGGEGEPTPAIERAVPPAAFGPTLPGGISGEVVGPDGRGIVGARVTALRHRVARDAAVARATTTEGGGGFRFDGLAPGLYLLAASAPGFTGGFRGQIEVEPGSTLEQVRIRLWAGGITLSGRVLDAVSGVIPGARVRATGYDLTPAGTHEARAFQVEADGEGRYRLQLPKGRHKLQADADGYARMVESRDLLGDQNKDFLLQPAARISGWVVTEEGRQPVAGAGVAAQRADGWRDLSSEAVTTDDHGGFRVDALDPGTYRVTARKEGLLGTFGQTITLNATEAVDDLELVVAATVTVRGRVTSVSGSPVAHTRGSLVPVGRPMHPFGPSPGSFTDEAGRYQVDGILPGEHRINLSANGYARHSEPLSVTGSRKHDIVLHESAVVTGVVLTAAGRPAAQASVQGFVRPPKPGSGGISSQAMADEQGRFSLAGLGGGQLTVAARHRFEAGSVGPQALETSGRKELTIRLGVGARVAGVVFWEDGSPVVGATVMSYLVSGDGTRGFRIEARTGQDGSFTVEGLPPGAVSLRVTPPRARPTDAWRDGRAPDQATLTLEQGEYRTGVKLLVARQ